MPGGCPSRTPDSGATTRKYGGPVTIRVMKDAVSAARRALRCARVSLTLLAAAHSPPRRYGGARPGARRTARGGDGDGCVVRSGPPLRRGPLLLHIPRCCAVRRARTARGGGVAMPSLAKPPTGPGVRSAAAPAGDEVRLSRTEPYHNHVCVWCRRRYDACAAAGWRGSPTRTSGVRDIEHRCGGRGRGM